MRALAFLVCAWCLAACGGTAIAPSPTLPPDVDRVDPGAACPASSQGGGSVKTQLTQFDNQRTIDLAVCDLVTVYGVSGVSTNERVLGRIPVPEPSALLETFQAIRPGVAHIAGHLPSRASWSVIIHVSPRPAAQARDALATQAFS